MSDIVWILTVLAQKLPIKALGVSVAAKSGDNPDLKGWIGAAPENSYAQTWAERQMLTQEFSLPGQQILYSL